MHTSLKIICCGFFCFCFFPTIHAQNTGKAPFVTHGSINTSASFYSSNESDSFRSRPKYAWNLNGSFVPKIGKFSFPFSFVVNDYNRNNKSPYVQMGISPTYKWVKLHLGTRYIRFSPLVYEGQSFTGAGVELNPKGFRLAAFYGRLNRARNLSNLDTIQKNTPRFSRIAYGVRAGVGSNANFFDVMYFHAKDDSTSVHPYDTAFKAYNKIYPQENAVLGTSFRLTFFKQLFFTGDVAVSGITQNIAADPFSLDSSYLYPDLTKAADKLLTLNVSSFASYAGQSALSFYSRHYNGSFTYRRVEPNFNSLGTPYMLTDVELFSLTNNASIIKGKLTINTGLSQQHNDLDGKLNSKLQTTAGNIGVNAILSKHFNVNVMYFGYDLKQKETGIESIDTNRLSQRISQFNAVASYNITKQYKVHFISGNLNLSSLDGKNSSISPTVNSSNVSASLSYTISFVPKSLSFSVSGLYNDYKQDVSNYSSYGTNVGAAMSLLKEKNLNFQATIGYFYSNYAINDFKSHNRNITYSLNTGYTIKRHSFNLYSSYLYTPPRLINNIITKTFQYTAAFKSFTGTLSYYYRL